jgi:hypothetical protein
MADHYATTDLPEAAATVPQTIPRPARYRSIMAGSSFVAAASAVAYADAGYPILSSMFAIVLALSFLVPLLLALPFARHQIAGAIALGLGAAHFVDVTFLGASRVSTIVMALLPLAIIVAVRWGSESHVLRFSVTAIGLTTLSILLPQIFAPTQLTPEAFAFAEEGKGSGRPYLHVILDEMGPLSLMPDTPEFAALQQRMRADYAKRGLELFDDTEVIAGATQVSLRDAFSRGGTKPSEPDEEADFVHKLPDNRLLEDLRTAGYRVNVLQTSFLRLCTSADEACRSYIHSGDGAAMEGSGGSFGDRIRHVLLDLHLTLRSAHYARGSRYYRNLALLGEKTFGPGPSARLFVSRPPQVLKLMRETAANLAALGRGEAFVGHFLLPHFPFVLGADCALKDPDRRASPRWLLQPGEAPFDLHATEAAYWEQAACTHDALMAMIDAVTSTPEGKKALVVVHGDHGSRILERVVDPHGEDAGAGSEERRHALFTHFAVRGLAHRQVDDLAGRPLLRDRIDVVLDALSEASDADRAATASTRQALH